MLNKRDIPVYVAMVVTSALLVAWGLATNGPADSEPYPPPSYPAPVAVVDEATDPVWGPFPHPKVVAPIPHTPGEVVHLQLDAPPHAWGIRGAARAYDKALRGVRIHTEGVCAARLWAPCLKVEVNNYGATGWQGLTYTYTTPRVTYLNNYYGVSRSAACHELGHALGLSHHRMRGCLGGTAVTGWTHPSAVEIRALRRAY